MEFTNKLSLSERKIAEDISYDDYDKLPIDNFGTEMLLRMGWKGEKNKKLYDPKPRNARIGLGAEEPEVPKKKENFEKKSVKMCYGTKVKITEGKHKGLKAKIVEKDLEYEYLIKILKEKKNQILTVELKLNKEKILIEAQKLRLRGEKEKKKNKPSRSRSNSNSKKKENLKKKIKHSWVHPNILVRIISKNSPYYNTKAIVMDLVDMYSFTLLTLKDKVMHSEFNEEEIETVIPKLEEDVIVLKGVYRGEVAKLLERDKKANKVIVQLLSDFSLEEFTQDDVAAIGHRE